MEERKRRLVRLGVWESEPLARLAAARLEEAGIVCTVQPLGVGPGGWGMAANLPHALYVSPLEEEAARVLLELEKAPQSPEPRAYPASSLAVRAILLVIALAVILSVADQVFGFLLLP